MNAIEHKILRSFEEQDRPLSADDLMLILYKQETLSLEEELNSGLISSQKKIELQEKRNGIRRRALYYIKNLENKRIISISRRGAKGKKYYILDNVPKSNHKINENSDIILDKHNTEYITRETSEHWGKKFSSLLIECENLKEKDILRMLSYSKSISDAISLRNMNSDNCTDQLLQTISKIINHEQILFSAIFEIESEKKLEFLNSKTIQNLIDNSIELIVSLNKEDLKKIETSNVITELLELCIQKRSKVYIHNKDAKNAPIFVGNLGPYSISEKDYANSNLIPKNNIRTFVVGMNNILCDVDNFLVNHNISDLRKALLMKGNDLFLANLNLRRLSNDLLPEQIFGEHTLDYAREYYRLWNYGLKDPDSNQENVILMLRTAKQTIASYAHAQSTIYTSCGMPVPFRTAFSVMFEERIPRHFSEGQFKKLIIKDLKDIFTNDVKETLFLKQQVSDIFNGGDRTRITKRNGSSSKEMLNELSFLLKSYSIPLLCYDFSQHEKILTLNEFIK